MLGRLQISCTFFDGRVSFDQLVDVVVDPYRIGEAPLANFVHREVQLDARQTLDVPVKERAARIGEGPYVHLMAAVARETPSLADLSANTTLPWLQNWAASVAGGSQLLRFNFKRFADYLRYGTIEPVAARYGESRPFAANWELESAEDFPAEDAMYEEEFELSPDETAMLVTELDSDRDDWARSEEDGWFYADAEEDEVADDDERGAADEVPFSNDNDESV